MSKHIILDDNTGVLFNKIKGWYINKHPKLRRISDNLIVYLALKEYQKTNKV